MFTTFFNKYYSYSKYIILAKKNHFIIVLIFMLSAGILSSYILIKNITKVFDGQLYFKANQCLISALNADSMLEAKSTDLIVEWQKIFPQHYIRLYADRKYLAGYYNIFNINIPAFEFNLENNANFFYTEINNKGYRGINLQTNRLQPQHKLGGLISIEFVENFEQRASSFRYILVCIWSPLIILYLIYVLVIRYIQNSHKKHINLTVDYLRKYNSNIYKSHNIIMPNIYDMKELIHIVQEIADSFNLISIKQRNFIADASHQLRTPLTILKLEIENLAKMQNVDILQTSINRMIKLSSQLLSLARFENQNLNLEKILWHDLIFNITSEWINIALKHNIDFGFENNIGNQINAAYVLIDKLMIEEAINNLIDNAIKYKNITGKMSIITIIVGCTSGTVWLKIIDNGIGIPENYREYLFNRFFRADNAHNATGSGLGLAIVHEIVVAHHGFIRLLDDENTNFLIVLPRLNNK